MSSTDGHVVGATQIVDNGSPTDRWTLALLAEGYTADMIGPEATKKFTKDAADFVAAMFATPPFDRLQRAINVFRVDVVSDEAGADDNCANPPTTRKTFFDAVRCVNNEPRLMKIDEQSALTVAAAQVPSVDTVLVLVNISEYAGSGGDAASCSLHPLSHHIALHEMGHTAFKLADEYQALLGCDVAEGHEHDPATTEPAEANITLDPQARGKWLDLVATTTALPTTRNPDCSTCDTRPSPLADGTIGTFEGAHFYHCGGYRPAYDCKMGNTVEHAFCAVCERAIERRLAPHMPQTTTVGVLAVDPTAQSDFETAVGAHDFVAAINAALRNPHWLGNVMFPFDSAIPAATTAVPTVRRRLLESFPSPAIALTTYLSLAADPTAGSVAIRDQRRNLIGSATTTETSGGAGSIAVGSFDTGQDAFDAARAQGIPEQALILIDLFFSPVEVAILGIVDLTLFNDYGAKLSHGDTIGALHAALTQPLLLGTVTFLGESSSTLTPNELASVRSKWINAIPAGAPPVITFPDHFSRRGDAKAGTPTAKDIRLNAVRHATTTATGAGGSAPGAGVFDVEPAFFDIAKATGIPASDAIIIVGPSIIV